MIYIIDHAIDSYIERVDKNASRYDAERMLIETVVLTAKKVVHPKVDCVEAYFDENDVYVAIAIVKGKDVIVKTTCLSSWKGKWYNNYK